MENRRVYMRLINYKKPTLNEVSVQEAKKSHPYKTENSSSLFKKTLRFQAMKNIVSSCTDAEKRLCCRVTA